MNTINNSFRAKVMKAAWTNFKSNPHQPFAAALKSAWSWAKKTLLAPAQQVVCLAGKIVRESEKAVAVNLKFECATTGKVIEKMTWFPKSLINRNGEVPEWFYGKKVAETRSQIGYNRAFIVSL